MSQVQLIANNPHAGTRSSGSASLQRIDSPAALGLRLSRQFAQCRREGGQLALLWIDIEVLEQPDKPLGEQAREHLIQVVSLRLRNRVRGVDEVLRVGDQGFAVLLMAAGTLEADIVERRLLQTARGNYGVDDLLMQVGVRIGTAVFPEDGRNGTELAEAACANLR